MATEKDKAIEKVKQDFEEAGGIDALVKDLKSVRRWAEGEDRRNWDEDTGEDIEEDDPRYDDEAEPPTIDVRLGYEPEWSDRSDFIPRGFHFMSGDVSFDQIHYSYCGASMVGADDSDEDLRGIAEGLLEEVLDQVAQLL